jgi:hypothetical protein
MRKLKDEFATWLTRPQRRDWLWFIPLLSVLGVIVIVVYAIHAKAGKGWEIFGTAMEVAAAAAVVGGLVGFLFGIPKTVAPKDSANGGAQTEFLGNTNLEQVSDWLTKILVGVGLVQLARAPSGLSHLAQSLKSPLGDQASSAAFGLSLCIAYAGLGFLFMYLWARVRFLGELRDADLVIQVMDTRDAEKSTALLVVNQQLAQTRGAQPTQSQLNEAIVGAPQSIRIQIFNQVEAIRATNWSSKPDQMKVLIPIFAALVAADTIKPQNHRLHGSYGWALKDQPTPTPSDYQLALDALTVAIEIRDANHISGWGLYEANRALCRIKLDPAYGTQNPTAGALVQSVNADLRTAQGDDYGRTMVQEDQIIRTWLEAHPL